MAATKEDLLAMKEDIKSMFTSLRRDLISDLDQRIDVKVQEAVAASDAFHAPKITELQDKMQMMEDYSRRENIIIHNFPLQIESSYSGTAAARESQEELLKGVKKLLDLVVPEANPHRGNYPISTAHRLPTRGNGVQPVVVRFYIRDVRNLVMFNRNKARAFPTTLQKPVFMADHLGPMSLALLQEVKSLQSTGKFQDCWAFAGKFYIKRLDNSVKSCPCVRSNVYEVLIDMGLSVATNHGYKSIFE